MSMFLELNPQPVINVGGSGGQGGNLAINTTSANFGVTIGKCYRVISNVDAYIRLGKAAAPAIAATNADIFLPAKSPIYLIANTWDQISAIAATGTGTVSAIEVRPNL